jgi:hypothetical protein
MKIKSITLKHVLSTLVRGSVLAVLMGNLGQVYSQTYPTRPIKWIITHAPGGLPDTVARIFAQKLGDRLGQPIIIDNKPGANGTNAAQALSSAPIDGYTFLITDGSTFNSRDEGAIVYTAKVTIDYEQGKRTPVKYDWKKDDKKYPIGNYKISIYQNGFKIGEGVKTLKKAGLFG